VYLLPFSRAVASTTFADYEVTAFNNGEGRPLLANLTLVEGWRMRSLAISFEESVVIGILISCISIASWILLRSELIKTESLTKQTK
jgi:hypothetical protein